MADQYSQGTHPEYDVVRSTQFVDDLSRPVCVSRTLHPQLANTNAWPCGNMENIRVSNSVLCNFTLKRTLLQRL
jgi:hypothetical protein